MATADRYYPLPEALDGGEWEVELHPQGGGSTTLNGRGTGGSMQVPLGASDRDRFVRYHEQGHIKFTPRRMAKDKELPHWLINAVEDARVNKLIATTAGFPMPTRGLNEFEVLYNARAAVESRDTGAIAALLYSKRGTEDYELIRDAMVEYAKASDLADQAEHIGRIAKAERTVRFVYDRLMGPRTSDTDLRNFKKTTLTAARMLKDLLDTDATPEEGEEEGEGGKKKGEGEESEEHAKDVEESLEGMMDILEGRFGGYPPSRRKGVWGDMDIVECPHTLSLPPRLRAKHHIAYDRGAFPRNIHRYCTDKRIFSRTSKKAGGSILIDGSGSMHWEHEQIEELINLMPAGVIGLYSGLGSRGTLRVLARDGRRVHPDEPSIYHHPTRGRYYGGGNVVDGPALDWLRKQLAPRYWISDAYVTGRHDSMSENLLTDAMRKMRLGRIVRVEDLSDAIELVKKRKVLV